MLKISPPPPPPQRPHRRLHKFLHFGMPTNFPLVAHFDARRLRLTTQSPPDHPFIDRRPKTGIVLQGNLPKNLNGANAKLKLEWIDEMLLLVARKETFAEWRVEGGGDGAQDNKGIDKGDDGKWSKREFWDREREETRRRAEAGREARKERATR